MGFADVTKDVNGVPVTSDRIMKVATPEKFDPKHVELATSDLRAILTSLEKYPEKHLDLQNALVRQDVPAVRRLVGELGISEEKLSAGGGHLWGVVVLIAIGCAVALAHD
ncbi:hypothetical protein ACFYUY_23205 [Kitasatospora sp. NPDC004745]|uniref:hypothetical protein n=1 Tax=unclassified Kitasatospora TaxID=2633591 RepID=UPI0033CF12EF